MITIKSPREVETMAAAGRIVAETAGAGRRGHVRPGVIHRGARPHRRAVHPQPSRARSRRSRACYDFPATLCTSINQEVVHGIPSPKRILKEGDLLSVDVGVWLDGLHADSAATFPVLAVSPEAAKLLRVTQEALAAGITQARAGNHVGDIGHAGAAGGGRRRGIRWCGSWWGTVSGRVSTRSPRCPTTASPSGARASWPG